MPKVSIIVPVHNPGKYLTSCLNSIINQTFQDIEILLIDDGSTDGSRQILKDYELRDARITTIFRRKGEYEKFGQKYSADLGRMLARGEYILMMDHDDELTPDAIEKLYEATENGTIDVVQGRSISERNGTITYITPDNWPEKTIVNSVDEMSFEQQFFHLNTAPISLWACLIRKDIQKDLELTDCVFNDTDFIWKLKLTVKTFCYLPDYIYIQHSHSDSASGEDNADKNIFNIFIALNSLEKFLKYRNTPASLWQLFALYKFQIQYGQSKSQISQDVYIKYMSKLKEEMQRELNINDMLNGEVKQIYQELMS